MFHSMRRLGSGFVAKISVVFIALAFALWGVGDVIRSSGPGYAAHVGNETISTAEFQRQKILLDRQMQAMGITGMDASKMDIAVLRQLIQQHLIREETYGLGLRVNDTMLAQTLRKQPQFTNKDGSFNAQAYKTMLSELRINEEAFLSQLRNETMGKFLVASLDMSDITPPPPVLALAASTAGETRDAVIVTVPAHAPANAVTDDAVKAYYEEHKLLYLTEPNRTLEYIVFAPGEITRWIDKEITDKSKDNGAPAPDKITEQQRDDARDDAMNELRNGIEDALAGGSTLGGAVEKLGLKAQSRILPNVTAESAKNRGDEVEKSAIEQGLALNDGEISGVITAPGSSTMLMVAVKSLNPASPKPFEAVASEARSALTLQLAREEARNKAQEIKAALVKEESWQAALEKSGLYGRPVNALPRPVEGKPNNVYGVPPSMQEAIFERKIGETAGPLSLPNGDQMLAVVTASHHPQANLETKPDGPIAKQLVDMVNQDIEGAAFTDFSRRHPVKVNPQLLNHPD